MLCSHSDFLRFFPYTLKVTTEAAKGTKMEARGNDDVETTRLIARFVSIRNSCRIFPAFQIAVVSMVLRGFCARKRVFDLLLRASLLFLWN